METTVKPQEIVNVSVMISDEMLDAIAKRLADRIKDRDIEEQIDNQIEYYMANSFDINDYSHNLDTYDITKNIVDEVIETIKNRL